MDAELRYQKESRVESNDGKRLSGYAIVFNSLSVDLGGFREIIAPEAVDRALNEGADIRALADHDSGKILGRTRSGTLQLRKDSRGLRVVIEPDPEISYARDLLLSVKRGDISGMSFGFRAINDSWDEDEHGPVRTVLDMKISEVSVVGFPAYEATSINARHVADAVRSLNAFRSANPQRTKAWYDSRIRLAR